jgi:hypothetical protein
MGEMRPYQGERNSLTFLEISQGSTARPYDRSSIKKTRKWQENFVLKCKCCVFFI